MIYFTNFLTQPLLTKTSILIRILFFFRIVDFTFISWSHADSFFIYTHTSCFHLSLFVVAVKFDFSPKGVKKRNSTCNLSSPVPSRWERCWGWGTPTALACWRWSQSSSWATPDWRCGGNRGPPWLTSTGSCGTSLVRRWNAAAPRHWSPDGSCCEALQLVRRH